jgi:hypothetical protein
MKIFASVIFLAAGLLVTAASGPSQTESNSVSSTIATHGNYSHNQPRVFKCSLGNATAGTASFVNIDLPGLVLNGGDTSGSGLTKQRVVESYGKLPLSFEANMGQTDNRVQFLSRGPGYTLFLTSGDAVLVSGKGKPDVARMKLTGSNPAPEASTNCPERATTSSETIPRSGRARCRTTRGCATGASTLASI